MRFVDVAMRGPIGAWTAVIRLLAISAAFALNAARRSAPCWTRLQDRLNASQRLRTTARPAAEIQLTIPDHATPKTCPTASKRDKLNPMVLSLSISPEAEARLKAKAAAAGVDVETYAARHLELIAATPRSLKDISGPIAEAFSRSGMSEDELSDFLETEKHAMRAEQRGKRAE